MHSGLFVLVQNETEAVEKLHVPLWSGKTRNGPMSLQGELLPSAACRRTRPLGSGLGWGGEEMQYCASQC